MPQPVVVLLRHSLMLKSAIVACLDDPKPKPVHQVRSATRRIEAILELLSMSSDIADIKRKSKPLRGSLRKIRRAAGEVRDLDVHRELLGGYTKAGETDELDKELARARKKAAGQLRKRLGEKQSSIQREFDDLEVILKPALDLNLSGGRLAGIARDWFVKAVHDVNLQRDDDLHSVRKACKTARYLAEVGEDASKTAAKVAARFEKAQQALGAWHDHLLLLDEAKDSLPDKSKIIEAIEADTRRLRQRADLLAKRLVATT
jgi:CHAD domain-containing protein